MFMGNPVSGNAPGQATLQPSTTSPTTGNAGNSGNSNPAVVAQPVVSAQLKSKTNFFDIFLSKKQIERNQKHAEVMAALKTYSKVEKQLIDLNNRLDKLIEVLTIATGGGTKSLLLVAADEAKASLSAYGSLLESLTRSHAQQMLSAPEIDLFHKNWRAANKKFHALDALQKTTHNYSVDVQTKIQDVISERDRLLLIHNTFLAAHPEAKLPPKPVRDDQNTQIGGDTGDR
jgi:hypothetical protein